jgi:hypothetical protein
VPFVGILAVYTTNTAGVHMEENKLRGLVAKRNRLPDVPDAVWEDLDKEGLIFAAAEGGDEEVEDLLRVAKRRLNLYQAGVEEGAGRASPPGREKEISGSQTVDIELREPEAERGVALSEFLVRLDDEDPTRSAKEARPIKSKITMAWGGKAATVEDHFGCCTVGQCERGSASLSADTAKANRQRQ